MNSKRLWKSEVRNSNIYYRRLGSKQYEESHHLRGYTYYNSNNTILIYKYNRYIFSDDDMMTLHPKQLTQYSRDIESTLSTTKKI